MGLGGVSLMLVGKANVKISRVPLASEALDFTSQYLSP